MNNTVERLRENLRDLQANLEREASERAAQFRYRWENGRIVFEDEARKRGRLFRMRWATFLGRARLMEIVTAPLIFSLIIPFVLLDLFVSVYQAVCFPVYGIPKVRRRDYIAVDRHKLTYLNILQKLYCVYCGYCNGLLAYVREVAGRTEYYWCPIKHGRHLPDRHAHYDRFVDYGDGEEFSNMLVEMKDRARACDGCTDCAVGQGQGQGRGPGH